MVETNGFRDDVCEREPAHGKMIERFRQANYGICNENEKGVPHLVGK